MQLYVVITLNGGILDEVMPFEDRTEGVAEFKHQAERSEIEADDNEDNFLDEELGSGFWTDGESENEVHLQIKETIPKQ